MSIRTLVLVVLAIIALVAPIALAWQHALTVCPVTDAWFGVNLMNGALVYLVVEVAALTAGFLGYTALRDMECPKWMVAPILAITPNLATITANKAKESVMTMRLFFAIILTIGIFVPMALIATFQEAFVCILGLGPLAFTAIDLILHVEYHYAVRELTIVNKELNKVVALRASLRAEIESWAKALLLMVAIAGLGGCGEVKVDETDYLDSYATEAYEMNALRTAAFPHPGVGVYAPQDGMQCTGWAWQGKMYSITHCSARGNIVFNKTGENPDPVVEVNVSSIHAAPVLATDLYTVGVECSPDLRWWGATTGEWRNLDWDDIKVSGYNPNNKAAQGLLERWQLALDSASQALLRGDQAFAEMQVASAMYIKAQWEVMTTGQRYCFASGKDQVGSAGFFRQGDSGGVLLAGDEPIGSVSYSNASETENCFSATQTEKTPEVFMAKLLNIETEWKADHLNVAYEPQGLARIVFKSLTVKTEKTRIAKEANMVTVVWILILGGLLAKIFRNRNNVSMKKGVGILALAWALVACSSTAEPVPAGMGQIVAAHNGECSAFHWQGQIRTAAHCTYASTDWRDNTVSVLHQVEGKYAIPEDLAEVGMECSPDLRWWGATTGKTLPVENVKFYAVKRGQNVWDLGEEVPAWTPGAQVCFRQSLANRFADGDSGGPLLAGDEPIGSVSWSSSLPWGMACFGRLETQPVWGGYVPTASSKEGKGFRMKSIVSTDSLAVTVLLDLAIVALCLMASFLLARIRAKFRTHARNAGNCAGLFGAKNPSKGHMSPILAFVARLTSVIVVLIVGVCLLAAPGAAPLVAAPAPALAAAVADGARSAKIQHRLDILFGLLQGLRHAQRKNWNANRWRRWLRSLGLNAPKAAMPTTAKAPAKTTRKGMSRSQRRTKAHKAKVAATKAEAKLRRHDRKVAAAMATTEAEKLAIAVNFLGLIARVARHTRRMEVSAARSARKVARKATAKPVAKKIVVRAEGAGRPTFHPRRSKVMGYNPMAISRQEIVTRREKREERRLAREARHLICLNGAYNALLEMVVTGTAFKAGWTLRGACLYLANDMAWVAAQAQTFEDLHEDVAWQYDAAARDIPSVIEFEVKAADYDAAWALLKAKDNKVLAEIKEANARARAKRKAEREQRIAIHRAKVQVEREEREAAKAVKAKERADREMAKAKRLVEALVARDAKKGKTIGLVDVTPVSPVAKLREVRANTPALAMVAGLGLATGMVAVAIIALAAIAFTAVRKNRAEDTVEDTVEDADWSDLMDAPAPAPAVEAEPQPLLLRLIELLPAEAPAAIEAKAPALPARYRGQAFEQLTEAEARALDAGVDAEAPVATCACGIPQEEGYVCDTCARNEYAADMANALEDALEEPPFTDPGDWDGGYIDEEYAAQLRAGDQEAARRDAAALEEHLQVLAEEAAFDEMIENGLDGVELVEKQEGEQTPEQIWASICTQLGVSTRNRSAIDAMNILIEMYQRKVDLYRFRHFGITRGYTRKQKDGSLKSGQTKTLRKDVIVRFASVLRQDKEMATWFAEASHDPSWEQFWPSIEALMKDKKQNWDAREWRTLRTRYEGAVQIVNDLCIEFLGKAKNNPNFRGGQVSCLASKDTFRYRVVDAAEAMAACKRINAVHKGGFCVARGVYQQQMQQGSHLPWVVDKLNGEGNWEEFGFVLTTTAGIADWGFGKHNRSNKSVELKTATEMLGGIVDLDHQKPERQFIEMFHKAWVSMRKPNLNDWKTFVREAAEKISPLTRSANFEVTEHEAKNGVIYSKAVTDFGTTAQTTYTFWNDGSETTCRVDSKLGATPKGFSLKFQSESKTIKKFFLRNSNYRPLKVLPWEIVPDEKELLGRYLANSWKLTHAIEQAILRNAHHGVNYTHNELIMSIIREGFAAWRELNVVTQEMSTVYHIKTHKPLTLFQLNKQNSILASLEGDYFVAETTLIPAPKPAPKSLPPIRSQYSINDDCYNSRNNPNTLIALFKRGYQWMASPSGYQLVSARKAAANPKKILKGEALATVLDAWIRATLKIQAQEGISSDSCENIADRFQMNFQSLLPGYVCSINAAEIESIALRTVKSHVNKLPDSDSPEVLAIIAEYFKQLPGHEEKLKLDREALRRAAAASRAAERAQLIAQGLDPDAEIPFCRAGAVLSVLALAAGLPAIAVVLPLAVTAVLAFMKMQNSDLESGETLTDDAGFCLYSTPIFRHTTGKWTAVTDNKNTEESPSVEAGESQKEKPMSFLDKMNQTIQNVWNELTGREKVVTEAKTKAPATYGSILASSKVEHTALTRICGAKIREMQVTELSSEDLREIKDFIRRDGDTWIIIRDSQKFHFPNWAMEKLVSEIVIAGHAVDKKVSQQEVNKYFGSLLWAPAEIVSFQASEAKVMSDGLAAKYDGTNLMSDELASSINWFGYAIRRLLTVLGLFKGMFIILPAGYFPPGVKLFGSEVKKHLRLRRDSGRALALQPQANGHSDVARTLGMQLWSMLLGPWIASVGFANLAKGAYGYAMSNLNKANERLLSPAEEEEDGRDALMAEASRQHGFNPIAVFRSFATSMANGLTKSFNPNKVNIAPVDEKGRSLVPNGYPMMLPWLALAELWLKVTGKVPEELARKVEDTEKLRLRLFKLANGAIPVLVHNMHRLDAAKVAGIRRMAIAAIATRIPTGKTSGIEVMLFDAEEYGADLLPEIVGRKKNDIEFWLFPCEETTAFKVASEGGDDDDLYEFLLGILHKLARLGLEWRAKILDVSAETQKAMDEIKVRFARQVAAFKEDRKLLAKLMEMPYAKVFTANGKVRAGWPSLLGVTMAPGGWQIRHTEAVEDIIVMTEKSREDIATQARLFAEVMAANNDSPFTSAIGTVAQSHKFATGILTGNVVLTNSVGALDKIWALFVLATILLSDMVDACNKGKKYAEAGAALMYLNWAWGWLCYRIASNPDAKVICPAQYLVSVPPAAKELFNARHANAMTVDGKVVQPGKLLNNLYENHRELGETVEAMIREEHNRAEFSATVTAMLQAVSVAVPGAASAQAMGSEVWAEVWTASGRKKIYLDGLKQKSAMRFEDIRAEQRYMAELNNVTVYAAHAQFDRIVMGRLVEADPNATSEEIAAMFKLCKLGMVYSYAFKTIGYEENCVKILMDEEGEFGASGGVPTYIIPVSGNCTFIGNFAGSSEILLEWMMNPATLALVAEIKAKTGDFKYVVLSMKGEAFGEMVDGGRDLTYTEANFDGKSIIEILCMPGVALAGNQREESHVDQSTWLASVADTVTQRRNDLLRRLKTENKAAEALLRGKTFGELLQEFNVTVVAESVTGTATVEKIEAFKWMDKKHQGRTYPNTFVIVRFSNEAGPVTEETEEDEITIVVGDEVTEAAPDTKENVTIEVPAAATVVAVPMTAEEKKQDMGNKLNRIFGKKEAEKSAAPAEVVAAPVEAEKLKILAVTEAPVEKEGYSQGVGRQLKPRVFGKAVKEILALGWNFRFAKDGKEAWVIVDTRFGLAVASGRTQKDALDAAVRFLQALRDRNRYNDVELSNALFEHAMAKASPLSYLIWLKDQPPIGSTPLVTAAPAVAAGVVAAAAPAATKVEKPTHRCVGNFALAGLQYSDAKDIAERELVEGAEITLVRNVAHPKDANAVEVHVNGYRFGYVPKETAEKLAPRMDIGVKAWAVITGWEHGYPRFDLFLGRTPTAMETFNFQRDKIDDACDRLMWLEAWDATAEQKSRAEATLAHFATLCGSLKL